MSRGKSLVLYACVGFGMNIFFEFSEIFELWTGTVDLKDDFSVLFLPDFHMIANPILNHVFFLQCHRP